MKLVLQNLRDGTTNLSDAPCPRAISGGVLVRSSRTLLSAGTERMLVEFGKANWIDKARREPHKVRQVLDKVRTDGLVPTIEAVRNKLNQRIEMGYCNAGIVIDVGAGVTHFASGDRVASNGGHAEVVSVPANLCARIPEPVTDEEAAFTVLGAIALQGIRLVQPTLGESIVVSGLGLVGLLTVQLLRAHGCRVLGVDLDKERLALAEQCGAETVDLSSGVDPVLAAQAFSRGRGVDAVLLTASTKSSEPVKQAAQMCRKRGRIVLVGVTGLELSRADFYEKELTFQVSCSYGPGRYDPSYEEEGRDYPIGFVRWTEQRNFEAVLDMMADGRLDVKPLITHRFKIEQAEEAYELLTSGKPSLGILIEYPISRNKPDAELRRTRVKLSEPVVAAGKSVVGFIGAGNYSTGALIPAFKEVDVRLKTVASNGGVSGLHAGRKFGFEETTTDPDSIFADSEVNAVVIATRHDSHARLVCQALEAGKHVFVEKPLCLTLEELQKIQDVHVAVSARDVAPPLLMVGFNRRFAPQVQRIRSLLDGAKGPRAFVMTVNAGPIPADHWTQDPDVGGGRIVGEACHFIDLLRYLAGVPIVNHTIMRADSTTADTVTIQLEFADGSIGTIHYFANGSRSFPKERLEVFAAGRVLQLDNFRRLTGFGWPAFKRLNLWRQDKGQRACVKAFVGAVTQGGEAPIGFDELLEVSRVTIEVADASR